MGTIERVMESGKIMKFIISASTHAMDRMNQRGVSVESILNAFKFGSFTMNERQAFEFIYAGVKVISSKEAQGFNVVTTYHI